MLQLVGRLEWPILDDCAPIFLAGIYKLQCGIIENNLAIFENTVHNTETIMPNFRHMAAFAEVFEAGTFTGAAKRMGVAEEATSA